MNIKNTVITSTDSYKISHWNQYPEDAEATRYYIESRGGVYNEVVQAGINHMVSILSKPVTYQDVENAKILFESHFGKDIFNYEMWMGIAKLGKIPVTVEAIPEGTVVPVKNGVAYLTTYGKYLSLAGHLETIALRSIWYPSTVATRSRECKKVLKRFLTMTSDLSGSDFDMVLNTRLHDFGARGASSSETAQIGGLAHLYNFIGTDTVESLIFACELLGYESAAGISIPAREHGTVISYGKENEDEAYKNSITLFGDGMYSIVYDSYDYKKAVSRIAEYKDLVTEKGGVLVIRPDSGDMIDNIIYTLNQAGKIFGYTVNSKGYKVLNKHVRIIQGDEIHGADTIARVLSWMETNKWGSENIAFGMGGGLLQCVDRDTQKYAMKMCAIRRSGVWHGVFKCPAGSEWKKSKSGYLQTITNGVDYRTIDLITESVPDGWVHATKTYMITGDVMRKDTLDAIRSRVNVNL